MDHVDLSQSLISHYLKDLKEIGIVIDEKRGFRVYYVLTEEENILQVYFLVFLKRR